MIKRLIGVILGQKLTKNHYPNEENEKESLERKL